MGLLFVFGSSIRNKSTARMAQKCYAAERNKQVILDVLEPRIELLRKSVSSSEPLRILEIASGTGEHAALFAESLVNIEYQPTDPQVNMHDSILSWTSNISGNVVKPPIALDVLDLESVLTLPSQFRDNQVHAMICINMIHISHIDCTHNLFKIASECLRKDGFLLTYGPYRVNGHMVESNHEFDRNLKGRNADWGVRDLEEVEKFGEKFGFRLTESISMPSNNLCNVFRFKEWNCVIWLWLVAVCTHIS